MANGYPFLLHIYSLSLSVNMARISIYFSSDLKISPLGNQRDGLNVRFRFEKRGRGGLNELVAANASSVLGRVAHPLGRFSRNCEV